MKHIPVLISSLFLVIITNSTFAQEIPKDTIYLEFKKNNDSLPNYRGIKFKNELGVNFNLYKGEGLIFPKDDTPDTLCYKHLKDYPITKIEDIDSLGKAWYLKNLKPLRKKYGEIIAPHDNNGKFATYIIEKFENYFVVYRVYWRNQKP